MGIGTAFSQQVSVIDATDGEPVPFVVLYNKTKTISTTTDSNGQVDIGMFMHSDTIYFESMTYQLFYSSFVDLLKNNTVALTPLPEEMDAIVLSASKFKQRKKDIPQKIISQNTVDVLNNNPQTSADLLAQSGQVFIQKSQQGGGSPLIRGFSTNRLLITVDGIRMNNAIFRGGNLQNIISIDPMAISRTEVILGPGSVVYGSDAIGGVMNFYSLKALYAADSTSTGFTGKGVARYATANNERTAHVDFNYAATRFSSTTSISANFFDDLNMGRHGPDDYLRPSYVVRQNNQDIEVRNDNPREQFPTGYDQISLLQKFRYKISDRWDITAGAMYSTTSEFDRYDALTRTRTMTDPSGQSITSPRDAEWYYDPQQWFLAYLKATHQSNGNWYDRAIITQSYQLFKEGRNTRSFNDPELFQNDEQVDAWSSAVDFERYDNKGNTLYYGAEYIYNHIGSTGSVFDLNTEQRSRSTSRYPDDSAWVSLAAYANYQWKIKQNLTLQTGLRYNHIWIDAIFDNTLFDLPFDEAHLTTGALTGAIGATYRLPKNWEFRANFSTAFRAPNIDDIGKIFDPSPGTVIVPNPDLDSEYSYTSELGVAFQSENGLRLDVAGYLTYLEDVLVARDYDLDNRSFIPFQGNISRVQAIQNEDSAMIYGVELAASVPLTEHFKMTGHYTYIGGEQSGQNNEKTAVRHVAPSFGDAHIIYKKNKLFLDGFIVFNGQLDHDELAPSQQTRPWLYALDDNGQPFSPRWYTLNVRSSYQITDALRGVATLENITDQRYRTYSSGIAAAGRNLILAINYMF